MADTGSFWSELAVQIIGTSIGAGLAAIAALWQYRRQSEDQKQKENVANERLDRNRLIFFESLLAMSIKFSENLEQALHTQTEALRLFPTELFQVVKASSEDLRRIVYETDHGSLFIAYRENIKCDNLIDIFHYVDTIHAVNVEVNNLWENEKKYFIETRSLISRDLSWLLHEIDEMDLDKGEEFESLNIIQELSEEYFRSYNLHSTDLETVQLKFIDPIRDIVIDTLKYDRRKWNNIHGKLHMAAQSIRSIRNRGIELRKQLLSYQETLADINIKIKAAHSDLEDYVREVNSKHP
jgi:hypothetical protein